MSLAHAIVSIYASTFTFKIGIVKPAASACAKNTRVTAGRCGKPKEMLDTPSTVFQPRFEKLPRP